MKKKKTTKTKNKPDSQNAESDPSNGSWFDRLCVEFGGVG
jgi:hypothetical protein